MTAALHGDELNGVEALQEVASQYHPSDIRGTLVLLHVVNVPGYHAQQRYLPLSDPFEVDEQMVEAPLTGLIVGILETPVALPGHPLCHLVRLSDEARAEIEHEITRVEFDGYRAYGQRWMADAEGAE